MVAAAAAAVASQIALVHTIITALVHIDAGIAMIIVGVSRTHTLTSGAMGMGLVVCLSIMIGEQRLVPN